jgi:hypothetical protein
LQNAAKEDARVAVADTKTDAYILQRMTRVQALHSMALGRFRHNA